MPSETTTGPAASDAAPAPRNNTRRAMLVAGGILAVFLAWELLTSVVAYTDDAYVRSDLVAFAPQVTGHVVAVAIRDNQAVRRGDLLAAIDPTPFQLVIDERTAQIREANAQAAADQDALGAARDQLDSAAATLRFAESEQRRTASLSAESFASRQQLDSANEALRRAQAARAGAQASADRAQAMIAVQEAAIARAQAELATAEWQLGRTELHSPVDGTINNLTVRVGDNARADTPLIGIVDANAWRIVANYKQSFIRRFRIGGTAWVWLDSHPWRFYRARIEGIGRGISRSPDPEKLLPYVAPATDWIRLQRRFPVTLTLVDPPQDLTLFMGADARAVIFP